MGDISIAMQIPMSKQMEYEIFYQSELAYLDEFSEDEEEVLARVREAPLWKSLNAQNKTTRPSV